MTLKIEIGQTAIMGMPFGDPMISFRTNDNFIQIRLKDLKDWISIIYESNGNRSSDAYDAKNKLDLLFNEIIHIVKKELRKEDNAAI